jgi:hypothetical protein
MSSLGMSSLALSSMGASSAQGVEAVQDAQPSVGGSAGFAQIWENAQAQGVAQSFATNSVLDAFSSGAGFMSPANSITV